MLNVFFYNIAYESRYSMMYTYDFLSTKASEE